MQKLTIYLAVLLFCVSMGVSAQQPEAMNVHKTTGDEVTSISLVSIEHITFSGDIIVVTTSEGTFNLPLDEVGYIAFGEKIVSINVENVDATTLRISLVNNTISVESDHAINALYLVDMTGKMLEKKKLSAVTEAHVVLPYSGVYILFLETCQGYVTHKIIMN